MAGPVDPNKFPFRMEGDFNEALYLLSARVEEGLSLVTETTLEFVCTDRGVDLEALLGSKLRVVQPLPDGTERVFPGICISAEFLGNRAGVAHYRASLRPWLWFLGRTRENRIFQDMSTREILQEVLSEYGFWADVDYQVSETLPPRDYTVQYRETDLDFIQRLMEEEGIYFHFWIQNGMEKMVIVDSPGAHMSIAHGKPIPFRPQDDTTHAQSGHIYGWKSGLAATTGKVTLYDYDFKHPGAKLNGASSIPKGTHGGNDHESYHYPGHFREAAEGDRRARVRMEAEAVRHHTVSGLSNTPHLVTGEKFEMTDHARNSENAGWLLTGITHLMQFSDADERPIGAAGLMGGDPDFAQISDARYRNLFHAIPEGEQYRAPLLTPWPEVGGVHTARVTGPSGEEIHCDEYGRIKVMFHWDRKGQNDESTSCWIRCMMPWTGKGWGMMAVPRIGQEVVVQFEEGDPDRPLVIGMLYNADTMPPWALPANKTQSGVKTRSTTEGTDKLFNELRFEDKKDSEEVYFHAERDYNQVVENDATISVGEGHKDKGDMELTVHRHLTETVKTGDHTFTVASGEQTIKVKKDCTETIEGKSTQKITKDVTRTVEQGNVSDTVKMGNVTETVKMGNVEQSIKMGNLDVKCDLGKITMEAMQSIELKVGGSSIKIDPMGVVIKGAMFFKAEGGLTAEMKGGMAAVVEGSGMAEVKGGAMLSLKGGITMIN